MPDMSIESELRRHNAELQKRIVELENAITERKHMEEELNASEEQYFNLFNNANDLIQIVSPSGKILAVNKKWLATLEYSQEEVKNLRMTDILRDDEIPQIAVQLRKAAAGESVSIETVFISKSGKEINVEGNGNGIFKDGKFISAVGIFRDITERRQAENQILDLKEFNEAIVNNLADGIILENDDGIIEFANPAMLRLLGYEYDELVGKQWISIVPDDQVEIVKNANKRRLRGESDQYEMELIKKSKERISVLVSGVPHYQNGIYTGLLAAFIDITERKQAVNALLEANRIISRSPAVAFLWSMEKDWPVEFVSENVEKLTGYSSQEFIERKVSYKDIIHSDDLERVAGEVTKYNKIEGLQTYAHKPYRIITKNGDVKWVDDKTYIRRDSRGITTYHEGIVSDITEEMKLEEQLRQSQKMESVGRLAGGVAHDFNNMLSVILGHTEIAMEQMTPDQRLHAHLTEIRTAAERSADLTRQLLAFARKQTIVPRILDLNETVEGMIKMLRRLIGEDIHLTLLPGEDLWPVRVDPVQIDQILANLCINSRDAIEGVGKVTIATGNVTLDEAYCADYPGFIPGEYVLLTVSDTGSGMDKETQERLYEPFFTTKEIGKGTGLGLATVYGIVKQNDGFIYVYSEPGQGTIFKIYLPRHADKVTQMQKEGQVQPIRCGCETVLVVEDESTILQLTAMMLKRQGYTVLTASSPGEAIRLAGKYLGDIHLLITDVVMPEMNGRDLARNLLTYYPDLSHLFMSGYTANVIAHHGVLDDGVHFIQKPFTNQDLADKVREAIDSEQEDHDSATRRSSGM